ncbi:HNH endonuclease domain protein [Methylocystis sp. SC2]|nr:HNH endonuclease domain protein [Methylocystis sp. SC2]
MLRSRRHKLAPSRAGKLVVRKRADEFYLSKAWKDFGAGIIKARGRRCESCGKTREADGTPVKLVVDHTIERLDGGDDLDPGNVKLMCVREGGNGQPHADGVLGCCHPRKTAQARADRLRLL